MLNTSESTFSCTVCSHTRLKTVIDFGLQPPANRFQNAGFIDYKQEKHRLALGYCSNCGTAQLTHRMPMDAIRPLYDWLIYNEPEGHLDEVATELTQLPHIHSHSRIIGVTYKDQSTIDRFVKLGLTNGVCINESDFGLNSTLFGLETIQQLLRNTQTIVDLNRKYGTADILLMRHIIEHAEDAAALIRSLRPMIADNGYLVMELPDSANIFKAANHAFIWEEHISYFTESSLFTLANSVGAEVAWFKRFSYPYEDSLLVAFYFTKNASPFKSNQNALSKIIQELSQFNHQFEIAKLHWRNQIEQYSNNDLKIAVFGAGHLAVKFINFFNLENLIDCVIDDNPNKAGMKMPGSLLPIVNSNELSHRQIKICLSTLNPESEIKVRKKLSSYFNSGGKLIPAFTSTKNKL